MGWGGVVVAHEILVTSPEAKFLFSFFGPFGALGFGLGLGLGLVNFEKKHFKLSSIWQNYRIDRRQGTKKVYLPLSGTKEQKC